MPNLSASGSFDGQGRPAGVLCPEAHDLAGQEVVKVRVPHDGIVRAPGLLPMLYKTSELCTELCIPAKVLRGWLRLGLPFKRDGRGHIWINGQEANEWLQVHRARKKGRGMQPGEGYCFRCGRAVMVADAEPIRYGRVLLLKGRCPACGSKVNFGARDGQ